MFPDIGSVFCRAVWLLLARLAVIGAWDRGPAIATAIIGGIAVLFLMGDVLTSRAGSFARSGTDLVGVEGIKTIVAALLSLVMPVGAA